MLYKVYMVSTNGMSCVWKYQPGEKHDFPSSNMPSDRAPIFSHYSHRRKSTRKGAQNRLLAQQQGYHLPHDGLEAETSCAEMSTAIPQVTQVDGPDNIPLISTELSAGGEIGQHMCMSHQHALFIVIF